MESYNPGKLFVGGVKRETTGQTLENYFAQYGQVKEATIVYDNSNGISRCFGFVIFADPSVAQAVLKQVQHVIDGRRVDVKPAKPKGESAQEHNTTVVVENYANPRKIFVGGLPSDITDEEFKNFFGQFGEIQDAVVMRKKDTGKPRGFGFVTFNSENSARMVLQNKFHKLKGKDVEVKMAEPKDNNGTSERTYPYACPTGFYNNCVCCDCQGNRTWYVPVFVPVPYYPYFNPSYVNTYDSTRQSWTSYSYGIGIGIGIGAVGTSSTQLVDDPDPANLIQNVDRLTITEIAESNDVEHENVETVDRQHRIVEDDENDETQDQQHRTVEEDDDDKNEGAILITSSSQVDDTEAYEISSPSIAARQ